MSLNVQLPKFEGPLGLLLYLIRKEEMDIMDIKIHEITHQYLEYIKLMKELDLEVAGEFVAMAATLIHIKSKMLLPTYDENGEIVEQEDPRKELVQKLLEYQKYQEAAKSLYERPLVNRDVFLRGVRESLAPKEDEIILEDNALFSLISSYRRIVKAAKKKVHKVTHKLQSIAGRILEMKEFLVPGRRVTMMEMVTAIEDRGRQALITFLSLLELGKIGFVRLYQTETYGDIWVEAKQNIEGDVISKVEEYNSVHSEQVADNLLVDAEKEIQMALAEEEAREKELLAAEMESQQQEFILKDSDFVEEQNVEMELSEEEIASDDEISLAEKELFGNQDQEV
ncbi:MAG: segregation and condensation protein A [Bdellovibrionia bacterium]